MTDNQWEIFGGVYYPALTNDISTSGKIIKRLGWARLKDWSKKELASEIMRLHTALQNEIVKNVKHPSKPGWHVCYIDTGGYYLDYFNGEKWESNKYPTNWMFIPTESLEDTRWENTI